MSFGNFLRLDIRGASHAKKMTFSIENFPAGVRIDAKKLAEFMERRAPGRDKLSTARRETARCASYILRDAASSSRLAFRRCAARRRRMRWWTR